MGGLVDVEQGLKKDAELFVEAEFASPKLHNGQQGVLDERVVALVEALYGDFLDDLFVIFYEDQDENVEVAGLSAFLGDYFKFFKDLLSTLSKWDS